MQIIIRRLEDESSKKSKKKKKKEPKNDVEEFDDEGECNYMFIVNRWFAKSEDDGQIVRELVPTDSSGNRIRNGSLPRKLFILWLRYMRRHGRLFVRARAYLFTRVIACQYLCNRLLNSN